MLNYSNFSHFNHGHKCYIGGPCWRREFPWDLWPFIWYQTGQACFSVQLSCNYCFIFRFVIFTSLVNNIDIGKRKREVIICTFKMAWSMKWLLGIIPFDELFLNGSRKLRICKVSANLLAVKGSCKPEDRVSTGKRKGWFHSFLETSLKFLCAKQCVDIIPNYAYCTFLSR